VEKCINVGRFSCLIVAKFCTMADWKNEEDINAELRELAAELRRMREELRGTAGPDTPNPTRTFLHKQSWPAADRSAAAADRHRRRRRRKGDR
jgi:hypothetical protein